MQIRSGYTYRVTEITVCPLVLQRASAPMAPCTRSARRRARGTRDALKTHTPDEHEPGAAVGGLGEDAQVDGSLILADFPPELLVILAEALGNPLVLLVSKAHLSKSFHAAACAALAILEYADLSKWSRTVDDARCVRRQRFRR